MDFAYDYIAKTPVGEPVQGVVYAVNRDQAWHKIRRMFGYEPGDIRLNPMESLRALVSSGFDPQDLARFYTSIGRRLERGRSLPDGLDDALEFILDKRLRQAVAALRAAVMNGRSLADAMLISGFEERDAMAVRSVEPSGRTPQAFESLAKDLMRGIRLRRAIRSVLWMPVATLVLVYALGYGAITFMAPRLSKFFSMLPNTELPPFTEAFYAFAGWFNSHLVLGTALYLAVGAAAVLFARSPYLDAVVDRIKTVREMRSRADMAALWSSFAMLYEAGVNMEEACRLLAQAGRREKSRMAFAALGRNLRAGLPLEQACARAGFPGYVARGVASAASGGDVASGIEEMAHGLYEDVAEMSDRLKNAVEIGSYVFIGLFVLGFVMVTWYPMVSATLSRL
ncbi:MAG: hypothetical protein DI596_00750 [Azospira oryzae]|nr:MAG: hypothetical protein DI596_00750 [Azospira oryzae]PZP82875.1 MAG: hypothetical protein DI593_00750 [Azospira oryzae]